MLIMLKVSAMSPERAFLQHLGRNSRVGGYENKHGGHVGMNHAAALGHSAQTAFLPERVNSTATSFFDRVGGHYGLGGKLVALFRKTGKKLGNSVFMGVMSRGWPMTPVEATTTSLAEMPRVSAKISLMRSAISTPFALQVLALPLLHITALALPFEM